MTARVRIAALAPRRLDRRMLTLGLPVTLGSLVAVLALPADARAVAEPALAIVNIAVWFLLVLWRRDAELPVFEAGPLCVGFTALYTAYPLIAFLLAGGRWTEASDNRLLQWAPTFAQVGQYAWRPVAYLAGFAVIYALVRGRATAAGVRMHGLSPSGVAALLWLFVLVLAYFAGLWVWFGVTYNPAYADVQQGRVGLAKDLPYVLQQISQNVQGILSILKLCGVAVLMQRWASPAWRYTLIAWLALEAVATALRMGARTETVVLLVAAVLLYHRMVRPLQLRAVAVAGPLLVCAALLFGFARDFIRSTDPASGRAYWSAANEFQVLMGTGYDLHMRQITGGLESVPWQVHAADALRLIPSQLLVGTQKIDPADWYLRQLGLEESGTGLMFGVMAQAAIGYGVGELLVRGMLLGLLFALAHRTYVSRARGFWVSMLYLYLCLWSYYTIRASSFYFVYVIIYRFIPTMLFVILAARVVALAAVPRPQAPAAEGAD